MSTQLETARTLLDQGELSLAVLSFAEAANANPASAAALGGWGLALAALERYAEALPVLREAVRLEPRAAPWLNALGVVLCQTGDVSEAETAFGQASAAKTGAVVAMLNLVDLYRFEGRYSDALDCLRQALALAPEQAEVWVGIGLLSLDLDEPEGAQAALAQLQQLMPHWRGARLEAAGARPSMRLEDAARAGLWQAWQEVLRHLPVSARVLRLSTELRHQAQAPRQWAADEIALFCRQHLEQWSPRSLARGIGGSEEAVIYLSRALTRLGWKVTVFGNPVDDAGDYDGVSYQSYYHFNPDDQFNILVSWRGVGLFSSRYAAKGAYLWLHDVPRAERFTPQRLSQINRLFVLSDFHRRQLPDVPDGKFVVTGNGIDVEQLIALEQEAWPRYPQRCIYTSSYDRGLETLLLIWPEVVQAVPQAELHVFYGWDTFDSLTQAEPEKRAWKAQMERLMEQPGVKHHGRVGQKEVLRQTLQAGIWAYPTHFAEISCITAMKCQAAGAVPVTSNYAALNETVQFGIKVEGVGEELFPPDKREEYKQALIGALRDEAWQARVRQAMMPWARQKFDWQNVAQQWDEEFRRMLTEKV